MSHEGNAVDQKGRPLNARQVAHRARMKARRLRQLARQPGFTAMPNKRIAKAMDLALVAVALEKPHLAAADQQAEAVRLVARELAPPAASKVRAVHRLIAKGNRSDKPEYRMGDQRNGPRRFFPLQEAAQ